MATVVYPLAVRCIDYPDERVSLLEIVLPVCAQRLLPAHVPCAVSICASRSIQVRYICSVCSFFCQPVFRAFAVLIPIVFYCLDDEAECRADAVHVFIHNLLHDGRLSCIVQSPMRSALLQQTSSRTHTASIFAFPCLSNVLFAVSTAF
jgi:hypothetical protein